MCPGLRFVVCTVILIEEKMYVCTTFKYAVMALRSLSLWINYDIYLFTYNILFILLAKHLGGKNASVMLIQVCIQAILYQIGTFTEIKHACIRQ